MWHSIICLNSSKAIYIRFADIWRHGRPPWSQKMTDVSPRSIQSTFIVSIIIAIIFLQHQIYFHQVNYNIKCLVNIQLKEYFSPEELYEDIPVETKIVLATFPPSRNCWTAKWELWRSPFSVPANLVRFDVPPQVWEGFWDTFGPQSDKTPDITQGEKPQYLTKKAWQFIFPPNCAALSDLRIDPEINVNSSIFSGSDSLGKYLA